MATQLGADREVFHSDSLVLLKSKMLNRPRRIGLGAVEPPGSSLRASTNSILPAASRLRVSEANEEVIKAGPFDRSRPQPSAARPAADSHPPQALPRSRQETAVMLERRRTPVLSTHRIMAAPQGPALSSARRVIWECTQCAKRCIPVRGESRCLCGHRYREHGDSGAGAFKCGRCKCPHFFFVVAEGAWMLRCRCKHKHTDHASVKAPHLCIKQGCKCTGFDSPWVCNCGHGWPKHEQRLIETKHGDASTGLHRIFGDLGFQDLVDVKRTDISEPLPTTTIALAGTGADLARQREE